MVFEPIWTFMFWSRGGRDCRVALCADGELSNPPSLAVALAIPGPAHSAPGFQHKEVASGRNRENSAPRGLAEVRERRDLVGIAARTVMGTLAFTLMLLIPSGM